MSEIDKCLVEIVKLKRSFWWNLIVSVSNLAGVILFAVDAVRGVPISWLYAVTAVFNGFFSGLFAHAAYVNFLKKLDIDIKIYELERKE